MDELTKLKQLYQLLFIKVVSGEIPDDKIDAANETLVKLQTQIEILQEMV
jgi:hypothetical protein